MQPADFKERNIVIAEDQPEYLPLPAHKDDEGVVVTCWKLTWIERIQILFAGRIFFTVLTFNHPLQPQLPSVHNPLIQPV